MRKIKFLMLVCLFAWLASCNEEEVIPAVSVKNFEANIDEHPKAGYELGKIEATTDFGTIQFLLESETAEGALAVNENTGMVSVNDPVLFDFDKNTTIEAEVVVANGEVIEYVSIKITINNILDDVSEIEIEAFEASVMENPMNGHRLGAIIASAPSGQFSYSIKSETVEGAISIDESTGEIKVLDSINFDFEKNEKIEAEIEVKNGSYSKVVNAVIDIENMSRVDELISAGIVLGYFPFSGDTNDQIDPERTSTIYGNISLTEDRFGNLESAYDFSNGVLESEGFEMPYDFSVSAWMKGNNFSSTSYQTITSKSQTDFKLYIPRKDDEATFKVYKNGTWGVSTNTALEEGKWIHVTLTHKSGLFYLYFDGMQVAENYSREDFWGFGNEILIGGVLNKIGDEQRPWDKFNGAIDDVVFYNRELTPEEVLEISKDL